VAAVVLPFNSLCLHLQINTQVPEWHEKYLNYGALKKLVKKVKAINEAHIERLSQQRKTLAQLQTGPGVESARELQIRLNPESSTVPQHAAVSPGAGLTTKPPTSIKPVTDSVIGDEAEQHVETMRQLNAIDKSADLGEGDRFGTGLQQVRHNIPMPESKVTLETLHELVPPNIHAFGEENLFFALLTSEIAKINEFYIKQERHFWRTTNAIVKQYNYLEDQVTPIDRLAARRSQLRRACRQLYRGLELLKNFRVLNYTGIVKIMKKHDKVAMFRASPEVLMVALSQPFFSSPLVAHLLAKVEEVFVAAFADGDRAEGMQKLRRIRKPLSHNVTFRLGWAIGIASALMIVLLFITRIVPDINENPYFFAPFPVFRGTGLVILYIFLWGVNTHFCRKYRINYEFILQANPRNVLQASQIMELASFLLVVWLGLLNLYLYSYARTDDGRPWLEGTEYIPLVLFFSMVGILVLPLNIFYFPTRKFFLRTFRDVVIAPFTEVNFRGFFMADQFTSLVRVFLDVIFSFCYFTTGDFQLNEFGRCKDFNFVVQWVVVPLPFYWRLVQCFRRYKDTESAHHLVNAGKYGAAICVTFLSLANQSIGGNTILALYISVAVIGTLYAFSWDIKKDWGFLEGGFEKSKEFGLLRARRVLPNNWYYHLVAILNLMLRVAWVLSISPEAFGITFNSELFLLLIGGLEVYRRNQWNFFRLENEHLNNCGKFRAYDVVPLAVDDMFEDDGKDAAPEQADTFGKNDEIAHEHSLSEDPEQEIQVCVTAPPEKPAVLLRSMSNSSHSETNDMGMRSTHSADTVGAESSIARSTTSKGREALKLRFRDSDTDNEDDGDDTVAVGDVVARDPVARALEHPSHYHIASIDLDEHGSPLVSPRGSSEEDEKFVGGLRHRFSHSASHNSPRIPIRNTLTPDLPLAVTRPGSGAWHDITGPQGSPHTISQPQRGIDSTALHSQLQAMQNQIAALTQLVVQQQQQRQ
jgi:EXS family/SPX domain